MKNLNSRELKSIDGGCFAYYAGWFLHITFGSGTGADGEDMINLTMHHATCENNDNCR